ncbi:hypothetical protein AVEN_253466-1 [Araneus ventricosus]|uniref:Uncharacterized protein n=1 Tax=Araneus ventricosus TaxID=182803 RepID=A0A4Y2KQX2_ARAVE|nr:hypothetical protein AVEN_14751-1 [Araneus ventricosus]GBN04884.1 hypothetical protein AVEN_253466-1 [Araneus ventricosus]
MMFGRDVPIVLISMQKKDERMMGQDRSCRTGDSISPIQGDECVVLWPLLFGVLHYHPRTKPHNLRVLVGPYSPILSKQTFTFILH